MACLGCVKLEDASQCVELEDGRIVCNYCVDYKDECLEREKKAKALLAMTPNAKKVEWNKLKATLSQKSLDRLLAVINRLKGNNE